MARSVARASSSELVTQRSGVTFRIPERDRVKQGTSLRPDHLAQLSHNTRSTPVVKYVSIENQKRSAAFADLVKLGLEPRRRIPSVAVDDAEAHAVRRDLLVRGR